MSGYPAYLGETTHQREQRLVGERRMTRFTKRTKVLVERLTDLDDPRRLAYHIACREFLPRDEYDAVQELTCNRYGEDWRGEPQTALVKGLEKANEHMRKQLAEQGAVKEDARTPLAKACEAMDRAGIPTKSDSLVEDVLWVNDHLHAASPSDFSRSPPSLAALQQLLDAQKAPDKFREKFVLPMTRKEADASGSAEAQHHDRQLGRTIQRCIGIATQSLREACAAGEALESPLPAATA